MRLTDFWERMNAHFGPAYSESVAHDHVIAALGERTIYQAIADGYDTKAIWRAVCQAFDIPASLI